MNRPRSCTSIGELAEHLLWYSDGRFSKHKYFKFIVHNMILREPLITISEQKEKIKNGDYSICKKIIYSSDTLRGPVFGVDCFWYRQEFAKSRGMVHWHGLCWRQDKQPHSLMHECIRDGLTEAECAVKLAEWAHYQFGLLAEHPAGCDDASNPWKDLWPLPEGYAPATPDEKKIPLINIHRCSDYCLRPNKFKNSEKECRMEFGTETNPGKPLRNSPDLEKDKNGCLRLELKRDHPLLVQHSRIHTRGWRANGDISLIITKNLKILLLMKLWLAKKNTTGYSCKGNKSSEAMSNLFYEMVDSSSKNATAKTFCSKYLMNTVKRDVSSIEASYEISRLPLYRCSHTFQCVSLTGFRVLENDGSVITKHTALDKYLNREIDDACSFYTFICKSYLQGGRF
ncbi:LOW QUALITY PROTEIN: hypothetical protein MAR_021079 [Mya arenaria]|uniref:Helitron helicase-like domain-containing protein n=1 Tax=Mya arenaria TaxID=6604 RepID=A0ABY7E9Q2_MYAAR|nr:LOW QUALITY PROTEIN: hypothetical protein MAR_021079 [Mya arenaria]